MNGLRRRFGPGQRCCDPRSASECPFALDIYGTNYGAYRVHPRGFSAVSGQAASLTVRVGGVFNDAIGNVRITGVATNENPFGVKRATIVGTLLNRDGQVVGVGWTLVFDGMPSGASASFDLRIEYAPYARYQLYGQATQG